MKRSNIGIASSGLPTAIEDLAILSGMIWAKFTWGTYWTNDPKLNGSAITLLIYFAYVVLRGSIYDIEKRARISAIYNIFAFVMRIFFKQKSFLALV